MAFEVCGSSLWLAHQAAIVRCHYCGIVNACTTQSIKECTGGPIDSWKGDCMFESGRLRGRLTRHRPGPGRAECAFHLHRELPPHFVSILGETPTILFRHLPPPDENDWFRYLLKSKWEISELGEPHRALGKLELLVESP